MVQDGDNYVANPVCMAYNHMMRLPLLLVIGLFLIVMTVAAYLGRISASPSPANAGIIYVTDRWTGEVFFCVADATPCMKLFPRPTLGDDHFFDPPAKK